MMITLHIDAFDMRQTLPHTPGVIGRQACILRSMNAVTEGKLEICHNQHHRLHKKKFTNEAVQAPKISISRGRSESGRLSLQRYAHSICKKIKFGILGRACIGEYWMFGSKIWVMCSLQDEGQSCQSHLHWVGAGAREDCPRKGSGCRCYGIF
jgi:hypothetical protein